MKPAWAKKSSRKNIYELSNRADKCFLILNCGALAETLLESELFGHEKGAFTGAVTAKAGLLESADGGVLLLDEIADMPLALQVKLLRVLQEQEVLRLGSLTPRKIDVRFLSASHKNLEQEVREGRFREDLYFSVERDLHVDSSFA